MSSAGRKLTALGTGRALLAQYRDWRAITATAGGVKYCYALGEPLQSENSPSSASRKATFLMVRAFQGTGRSEVSVVIGYKFKNTGAATIELGGTTFPMYTEDENGWIKNLSDETRLVEAMRSGSRLVVKGVAASGMTTSDQYSLVGLAEAIDRAAQECR